MSDLVLDISSTGKVEGLHVDAFALSFLGDMKVRRQSEIVFDDAAQTWIVVYLAEGIADWSNAVRGFSSYDEARQFEVMWLNNCRIKGASPTSPEGMSTAQFIKSRYFPAS